MKPIETYSCDGSCYRTNLKEVRVMPTGPAGSSNLILCYRCYIKEIIFREERNKEVSTPFPLPEWSELKIYTYGN